MLLTVKTQPRTTVRKTTYTIGAFVLIAGLVTATIFSSLAHALTGSTSTLQNFVDKSWYVAGQSGGMAVDDDGNVYVPHVGNEIIMYSYTAAGTTTPTEPTATKTWTGFTGVSNIAVDDNGYVYVTDGNTVKMFNRTAASGTPAFTTWTGFSYPWGIDVDDDGDIVVANSNNATYKMFNRSASAGAVATTDWTGVNDAWSVTLDDSGNVYAGGWTQATIKKFSKTEAAGTPASITTYNGLGYTWLNGVHWADGYVYYAMNQLGGNGGIQRFPDSTAGGSVGSVVQLIGLGGTPYDIGSDSEGAIYGLIYDTSQVVRYIVPRNVASLTFPSSSDEFYLELPAGNDITAHSVAAATVEDEGYEYPFGLISYTFRTLTADPQEVKIYFQTDLAAEDVTPRKFVTAEGTYAAIADATITETTWGGKDALLLTYDINDGGDLDEDGAVNGSVSDPVTLAIAATPEDDGDDGDGGSGGNGDGGGSGGSSETDGDSDGSNGIGTPNTGFEQDTFSVYRWAAVIGAGAILVVLAILISTRAAKNTHRR